MQVIAIETIININIIITFVQGHRGNYWQQGPESDSNVQGLTLYVVPLLLDSISSSLFCILWFI